MNYFVHRIYLKENRRLNLLLTILNSDNKIVRILFQKFSILTKFVDNSQGQLESLTEEEEDISLAASSLSLESSTVPPSLSSAGHQSHHPGGYEEGGMSRPHEQTFIRKFHFLQ